MQNFKKKYVCLRSCWWCKIGVKWPICPNQRQGPLLEISFIPLLSVMTTFHYHSLEDMKQLCVDRSHLHTGNIPTPKLIIKPDLF